MTDIASPTPSALTAAAMATVIVLAAQRTGVVNPLAEAHGVSHKCLVPICGQPLIHHVLETLTSAPGIGAIRISIEAEAQAAIEPVVARFRGRGHGIDLVASRPGIVDSVAAAAGDGPYPLIITTADNVLLTHDALAQARAALADGDAVIGLAGEEAIKAAHPEGQRRFYQFADGGYANCNLYALADARAFAAAESFREGGQFMKNSKRLVRAFGLFNILLMRTGLVTLERAMRRVSRRFGVAVVPLVFADGALAIDVDNERTYRIAEPILARRLAER